MPRRSSPPKCGSRNRRSRRGGRVKGLLRRRTRTCGRRCSLMKCGWMTKKKRCSLRKLFTCVFMSVESCSLRASRVNARAASAHRFSAFALQEHLRLHQPLTVWRQTSLLPLSGDHHLLINSWERSYLERDRCVENDSIRKSCWYCSLQCNLHV